MACVRQRWCGVRRMPDKFDFFYKVVIFFTHTKFFLYFFYPPDRQRTFPEPQTQDGLWCMTDAREHSSFDKVVKISWTKKNHSFRGGLLCRLVGELTSNVFRSVHSERNDTFKKWCDRFNLSIQSLFLV